MTTAAPTVDDDGALPQHRLAPALATAIDEVRDAVDGSEWRRASARLAVLVEINGRDRCLTRFVRNQIGRRAEWLERWIAARPIR